MPKLVCAGCQVELVVEKTGVDCVDMFNIPPEPYQITNCDAWMCPSCGVVILAGFANQPYARHFEHDFKDRLNSLGDDRVIAYEHVGYKDKYGLPASNDD